MRRLLAAVVALLVVTSSASAEGWRPVPERTRWSWYGGPRDAGDNDRPASGVPNTIPGIARYNRRTLGDYFVVGHRGDRWLLRQTDIGPAPGTGRGVDINYSAVPLFGYRESNFPTDAQAEVIHVGGNLQAARERALRLGARIPGYRMYGGAASPEGARRLAAPQEGVPPASGVGGAPAVAQGLSDPALMELMGELLTGRRQRRAAPAMSELPNPFFSALQADYLRPRV